MKWYKHDANANSDAKLRRVRLKYGMEGYGLYWYCLELIAQNVEKHNLSFELEHDAEIIAADTGIHFERVQEMMTYMVGLGLFESENGIITCIKLAKRCDEYTAKLISQLESVPTRSRQSRDKVRINRTEQNRLEQTRPDQKKNTGQLSPAPSEFDQRFAEFKLLYPKRGGSQRWPAAQKHIRARLREGHTWDEIMDGARRYAGYIRVGCKERTEFVLQAATFVGTDKGFREPWDAPATKADTRLAANLSAAEEAKQQLFGDRH